jgi:DNA-binding MarR family transcriptional regulator
MRISTSYAVHKLAIEMDRVADSLLQNRLHISYRRFYFLLVLAKSGRVTQHAIAKALGYSDPAVSNMVNELLKEALVEVNPDPTHGRRRLVAITPKGNAILDNAMQLLDECFSQIAIKAQVDEVRYGAQTEKLINAMKLKRQE